MPKGYKDLLADADAVVRSVEAADMATIPDGVVMVDIRDPRELEREGMIPGAFHAPRGMLEFWIDPESPLPQADIRRAQDVCVLLRVRLALAARRQGRAGDGT